MTKLEAGKKTTIVSALTNVFLALLKTTMGILSGSAALLADGIHSVADLLSDLFAYGMIKISHEGPDEDHPYGHGKFESIGTLALAVMLSLTAGWIAYKAITQLLVTESIQHSLSTLALAATLISIISNEALYHYCKNIGKKVGSSIIIANAWHHRTDSLSSIAAFIGIGFSLLGFPIADSIAALLVTALLLKMSYQIGKEAVNELVDTAVSEDMQEKIMRAARNISSVAGCHELRTRLIGGKIFVDVHVEVPAQISVSEGHALAESVERAILESVKEVQDVITHIDPIGIDQKPIPQELKRPEIETHIENLIQVHFHQETKLHNLYFHMLKSGYKAEVILHTNQHPTAESIEKFKKELSTQSLFEEIQILVVL